MEIQLTPESEAQLTELARRQGRDPAAIAGELVALGLQQQPQIEARKQELRAMLDKRWDDYKSGRSVPLDVDEVRRQMKAKNQVERERRR